MRDLISRQAALKAVSWDSEAYTAINMLPSAHSNIARDIATIIENEKDMRILLNAQSRVKGEWIDNETSYTDGVRQSCTCSICGKRSIRPLGDFCRWCGADMRGEQDE